MKASLKLLRLEKRLDSVIIIIRNAMASLLFKKLSLQDKNKVRLKIISRSPALWIQEQIHADLDPINSSALHPEKLDLVMQQDQQVKGGFMLVRYRIQNNQLESTCFLGLKKHPRFFSYTKNLKELLKTTEIPDADLIVSLLDAVDRANFSAPVFAFAKDSSLHEPTILIPDFEALEGYFQALKNVKKGIKKYPWDKRLSKALWRGSMSGGYFTLENFLSKPRSQVVFLSNANPDLIDAKFSTISQCSYPREIRQSFANYFSDSLSIREHLQYKYQILIDGNSCSYSRAFWQLFSCSLIFKQNSPHIQWYYRALVPQVHYIPVRSDFSDLVEKTKWAQSHDLEAQQIALQACQFAQENLQRSDVFFYLALLLKEYAKKQKLSR